MTANTPENCLDDIERNLLDFILQANHAGIKVEMNDLVQLTWIGSRQTIYGRITHLISLNYLKTSISSQGGRKKYFKPTKLAAKYEASKSDD
ncbi:hypothetical protein [Polynucleobacter antarcticus]|uniref:Uncharacterized protein n=1 Tax=Polynucleobacter antarcticus TaxID=1743162 RepID=A0A6M9PNI4_9BURK|nr:hypothetical protein [Polynucleobacter antarcticus]QKM62139.1 hypothetical protein DCO16_03025 [Polynucleobacter antarcticus]